MIDTLESFHLIRPVWIWALLLLGPLWWILSRASQNTHWEKYIPRDKLEALRVGGGSHASRWRWMLMASWILGVIAAAGPAWKTIQMPALKNSHALVIALDLSRSMLATDLAPDRLTRARFKLIDILRERRDGLTALVAYAGDAHRVSPLTDDTRTIEILLPALHPEIMPVAGSNTEAAVTLAADLLRDAGQAVGDILLITDGVVPEAQRAIRDSLDPSFRLSILGIGNLEPVPIPSPDGGFVRTSGGEIVLATLNREEMRALAGVSGGRYAELQTGDADIEYLLREPRLLASTDEQSATAFSYDTWEDAGYWLVVLLLPCVAWNFRRGVMYSAPLLLPLIVPLGLSILAMAPATGQALSWEDLWLRPDQQAERLMREDRHAEAAEKFTRDNWRGAANFRAKNYPAAEQAYAQSDTFEDSYNRGNALAYQQRFEEALSAYQEVLDQNPEHPDALHNKQVIEQLMQQQQDESGQSSEGEQSPQGDTQESGQHDSEAGAQHPQNSSEQQQGHQDSGQDNRQTGQQDADEEHPGEDDRDTESENHSQSDASVEGAEQQVQAPDEPTPEALQHSSERWLRAIPDDPGGLLRRKFEYETQQRKMQDRYLNQMPSNPDNERF